MFQTTWKTTLLLSTALLLCASTVQGHSSYRNKVPNGLKKPGNCDGWGHSSCSGGQNWPGSSTVGSKNSASTWGPTGATSSTHCKSDDDGDNFWNGEELGDACCYWSSGDVDARGVLSSGGTDTRISNPRNVNSIPVYNNLFGSGTDIKLFRTAVPESFDITEATRSVSSHPFVLLMLYLFNIFFVALTNFFFQLFLIFPPNYN